MTPELIVAAFLNDSTIAALVDDRIACAQLPKNCAFPAIVYNVIDLVPEPHVNFTERQPARARVQITAIATTIAEMKSIHAAVRALMDWQHHVTVAGSTVTSSRFALLAMVERDNEAGLWVQSADYIVRYYET